MRPCRWSNRNPRAHTTKVNRATAAPSGHRQTHFLLWVPIGSGIMAMRSVIACI